MERPRLWRINGVWLPAVIITCLAALSAQAKPASPGDGAGSPSAAREGGARPCAEDPHYIIRPGREPAVQALCPYRPGGPVNGGWTLQGIHIHKSHVEYSLTSGRQRQALALYPPTRLAPPGKMALSPSFVIGWKTQSGEEPGTGALAALWLLARRVQANDRGAFWGACATDGRPPPRAWLVAPSQPRVAGADPPARCLVRQRMGRPDQAAPPGRCSGSTLFWVASPPLPWAWPPRC